MSQAILKLVEHLERFPVFDVVDRVDQFEFFVLSFVVGVDRSILGRESPRRTRAVHQLAGQPWRRRRYGRRPGRGRKG